MDMISNIPHIYNKYYTFATEEVFVSNCSNSSSVLLSINDNGKSKPLSIDSKCLGFILFSRLKAKY